MPPGDGFSHKEFPRCLRTKPVHSRYFHGPLYQKMSEDLHLTGKAERTVHGYLRAVRQLADYCRKSPRSSPKPSCDATFFI